MLFALCGRLKKTQNALSDEKTISSAKINFQSKGNSNSNQSSWATNWTRAQPLTEMKIAETKYIATSSTSKLIDMLDRI